ncbi:MAG: hypothetical protein HND53_13085 [Proteobacteria bacterium]|nr:hypothetical protein [Pseudomonadota bacterium]NOG61430.1 hypothetical protein [Pseudomonadota bacterium]
MKKIFLVLLGTIVTASIITALHVVQGMVLDDWSGVHPYNRVFQLPLVVGIGFALGLIILTILRVLKMKKISNGNDCFKLGLILGTVGISSLIHPWIKFAYTDYVTIFVIFMLSFYMAYRFSLKSLSQEV